MTVTLIDGVSGQKIKATDWNANNASIRANLNAGLDKNNFSGSPDLPASVLHAYPSDVSKVLAGDGSWINSSLTKTKYGQVDVSGTSTETVLISQTINGGTLGVNGILQGTIKGDWLQNSGGNAGAPRFKLYYGAAAIIDTGTAISNFVTNASRYSMRINFWVNNQDTAHQYGELEFLIGINSAGTGGTGNGANAQGSTFWNLTQWMGIWQTAGTTNVDSTANQTLALKVINASSAGSYSTRMQSGLVVLL